MLSDFVRIKKKKLLIDKKSFLISGTLTIDQDFEFINCDIQMGPNARIEIENGKQLWMTGCHIHGCETANKMWAGIFVDDPTEFVRLKDNII